MPPLSAEIQAVEALCRQALETDYFDLAARLTGLPKDPDRWIDLLHGLPDDRRCKRILNELCEQAERLGACPPGSVERFGVLQASLAALPQLESQQSHDSLNRQFCATIRRVASRAGGWGQYFHHNNDAFEELARIVSLRRLHAGQISFDIMGMPRAWLLKVHPLALPDLVRELIAEMGGLGPIVMPHLNYWRANPITMLQKENEISHHRIVQFMEQQPRIRGLVSASWLYSSEIESFSPHIAWLRDFYVDNGAYLVDMEVAHQEAGFLVGSETRRRLHADGKLRPRETLVIWSRERMLAWARETPQSHGAVHKVPAQSDRPNRPSEPKWRSRTNEIPSSGQYTCLHWGLFLRQRPRQYIFTVFCVPLILLALAIGATMGVGAVAPAVLLGFVGIWLLQYFFLQ
jgi:hypothetical protein